jgi:hypothetical protein
MTPLAKAISPLMLLAFLVSCSHRTPAKPAAPADFPELADLTADMNRSGKVIAVGDWSKPVQDDAGYSLRGRLLVFDTPHYRDQFGTNNEWWGNAPVFLELENLTPRRDRELAVYFALGDGLECEFRDADGKPTTMSPMWFINGPSMPWTRQNWVTVPFDGSVRLRADPQRGGFSPKPNGLIIQMGIQSRWNILAGTNNQFLSGNFSPPTNHPPPPGSHVWQGTLKLPAARISSIPQ